VSALQCTHKRRVYYKTIKDRTSALRSTESGAYITER